MSKMAVFLCQINFLSTFHYFSMISILLPTVPLLFKPITVVTSGLSLRLNQYDQSLMHLVEVFIGYIGPLFTVSCF